MILVDTSVWIDHFRAADGGLVKLLEDKLVLMHPFVLGEIALGNLRQRRDILDPLGDLPATDVATDMEVFHLIERHRLFGTGIGYVDAHLLAAVRLTVNATLWTRDRRLTEIAARLAMRTH